MISNSVIGIAAGVCGTIFLGYCIYFDQKRRSDPNYKKMIRERRKAASENKSSGGGSGIPHLKDNEAVQKFFLQEVQLGEEMLAQGDVVNGVEHLANAVAVCGQPQQLLNVLSSTLPQHVFKLLLHKLSQVGKQNQPGASGPQVALMVEEDVE